MFKKSDVADMYSLSPMQEGILFHYLMDEKTGIFMEQTCAEIKGELDVELLNRAFNRLIDRYDVLRTVFVYKRASKPRQVLLKAREAKVYVDDISHLDESEKTVRVEAFKRKDRETRFDLSRDVPIRFSLLKLSDRNYMIVLTFHHIIMDGWCVAILIQDLLVIYNRLLEGREVDLLPPVPYKQYIKWLEQQDRGKAAAYWETYLTGYENQAAIPRFGGNRDGSDEPVNHSFKISKKLSAALAAVSSENKVTLSTTFQVIWGMLLQKYNDSRDVVFGSVVSGRPAEIAGIETMIGLFINTVPVRIQCGPDERFEGVLKRVQAEVVASKRHEFFPLAEIQSETALKRDLLNHIIIFENYPVDEEFDKLNGENEFNITIGKVEIFEQTNYDLNIFAAPAEELGIKINYNPRVYDCFTIRQIEDHLRQIIRQVSENPEIPLDRIAVITESERQTLLHDWNDTASDYVQDKTVYELFKAIVNHTPHRTAAVFEDRSITLDELNRRSRRLANVLRAKGIKPNSVVGLMPDRSMEMLIGLWGILASGGAYLPIDREYPEERIAYMLEDSGAELLITRNTLAAGRDYRCESIGLTDETLFEGPAGDLTAVGRASDLMYVTYTSGSTGKPKGVMIENRMLLNFMKGVTDIIDFNRDDRMLTLATISFDIFGLETIVPMFEGARIVIGSREEQLDSRATAAEMKRERISIIQFTPSRLQLLMSDHEFLAGLKRLRHMFLGAEEIPESLLERLRGVTTARIFNFYGPTETTVYSTIKDLSGSEPLTIGRPIANTQIYILDKAAQLQPVGALGELCIGGDGLARGYSNRVELTAEKFCHNPIAPGRIYRTGDVARWLESGEIDFKGRQDHQVKVRGFRIELGEIEDRLRRHEQIKDAVVMARNGSGGDKYLCAYYVAPQDLPVSELREYIGRKLPDYMVPSLFVSMEKIPLTTSGKVNRKALPEPENTHITVVEYEPPENETEKILSELWQEVLGVPRLGVRDNFFELGGHSFKVMVLVALIHKALDVNVPVKVLFDRPTIREFSDYIIGTTAGGFSSISAVEKREYYPISSAQRRMYFLNKFEKDSTNYNISEVLTVRGRMDVPKLEDVFRQLIRRHESFRTAFDMMAGEPIQRIYEDVPFAIERTELKDFRNFIRPFELDTPPLLRVGVVTLTAQEHRLVVDMHHIISDGASIEIVVEEFSKFYNAGVLPALKVQYKDYALWQRELFASGNIESEEKYWLAQFQDEVPVLNMFTDYPRPHIFDFRGSRIDFSIGKDLRDRLDGVSRSMGTTLYMLLLAAFNVLLHRYTGQGDIVVGSPILGRPHADLQYIVGMFVNMVALRNRPHGDKPFADFLLEVKDNALKSYENQNYQFEELVNKLDVNRDTGRNPLFDVTFTFETMEKKSLALGDMEISAYVYDMNVSKFDISLYATDAETGLDFCMIYCTALYGPETMGRLAHHFTSILTEMAGNPRLELREFELLAADEKRQLLFDFNDREADYPENRVIHELFNDQVRDVPDNVALVFERAQVTYGELDRRASRLAVLLRDRGIGPNSVVALMVERSPEMLAAILAVLKAGGTYLPLDPDHPAERIKYMLADSGTSLILTGSQQAKTFCFTELTGISTVNALPYLTATRPQIGDFDGLPIPDRSLVNYEKYGRYIGQAMVKNCIAVQGTRGCPYNCAYCHKIWPRKHVARSAENIFQEVRLYYGMGVKRFAIIDDIFNLDRANSSRFFELIIEKGLDIQLFFPNGLRGDILTTDYLDLMVKAGTVGVALALETASPRLQKLIGKNLNLPRLRENIEYFCHTYPHVILELFTMHGFPTETEEEAMLTLNFIKSLKWLHFPYVHILKIYPNTDMAALAVENGVSAKAIAASSNLAYHELPETLPVDRSFTLKYQADFLNEYFLSTERLRHVLPYQMQVLTRDEMVQKYNSYLPVDIHSFDDLLRFLGIQASQVVPESTADEEPGSIEGLNEKIGRCFPVTEPREDALRVLLLDLSQYFSSQTHMLYDVVEPPLGLMSVMTYLNHRFGSKVNGKIAKSRIDFDSYAELRELLEEFKPDVIGIRTLSFYKDFFHLAVAKIRQWGLAAPIVAGGPYATSDYGTILQDRNIDLVVMGEGEHTFAELVQRVMENHKQLPDDRALEEIGGIAFIPAQAANGQALGREILFVDDVDESPAEDPGRDLENLNGSSDLAYIIYTSGTTGKPKGAMIEHANVVRLLFNDKFPFDFKRTDVWTMFHAYNFDFSVWEMYGALLYGGRLVVVPKEIVRDPALYLNMLKEERVTVLNQTPSAFYNLINQESRLEVKDCRLKYVIFGGEALKPFKLKQWREKYPDTRLVNMYGITETTVHVTYKEIGEREIERQISNIGSPIPTLTVYVMDENLKLAPLNVPAELCVGGKGLGRGYLNRQELTGEKFTASPYNNGERLYRSGDLARLLPNGELEYLGRIDHQVQVRGFRVELGEIENRLLKHGDVKEAVVISRGEDGDQNLCAYVVAASADSFSVSALREYLSGKLPDYMIPNYFVQLEALPLTANGKVDRRLLPEPGVTLEGELVAPRNELETKLLGIWKEELKLEKVGIRDNYFQVGGDSIKAIRLVSRINGDLARDIRIADIYSNQTIEELARQMGDGAAAAANDGVPEVLREIEMLEKRVRETHRGPWEIDRVYPMSDIERGMFFYYLKKLDIGIYHDQTASQFVQEDFDPERFKKALFLLVDKHPILRTGYLLAEDAHIIYKEFQPEVPYYDLSDMERDDQGEFIKEYLARSRANYFEPLTPPWRMTLFPLDEKNIILTFEFLHALLDGWSNATFMTELHNTYLRLEPEPGYIPVRLKADYREYIIDQLVKKVDVQTIRYWKHELEDYKRVNFPATAEAEDRLQIIHQDLGRAFREELEAVARRYNTVLKHLCFGAYAYMLNMLSYDDDIVVGLVTNNRPLCEDGDKIVGCFLNTVPVRIKIPTEFKFSDYIRMIDQKLVELKKFDRTSLFEIMKIIGEKSHEGNPIFDDNFNYIDFHVYKDMEQFPIEEASRKYLGLGFEKTNTMFDLRIDALVGNFMMFLHYSPVLVSEENANKLCGYFVKVLRRFVEAPESIMGKDMLLDDHEKQRLLRVFNSTDSQYPEEETIQTLFEAQVQRTPDHTAVRFADHYLSYRQLNRQANRLAGTLQRQGVQPGTIVALMLERSLELVTGMLAVLKAGGAYLPIDVDYPEERKRLILQDSGARLLGSKEALIRQYEEALTMFSLESVIALDSDGAYSENSVNPASLNRPSDPAYIIYTSGTTGIPKGVMIEHRGLVNYAWWAAAVYVRGERVNFPLYTSISFDLTVTSIYTPLMTGNAIVGYGGEGKEFLIERLFSENDVDVVKLTPSHLRLILEQDISGLANSTGTFNSRVRRLIVGGEQLDTQLSRDVFELFNGNIEIYNEYGPTETVVGCMIYRYNPETDTGQSVPIGVPADNVQIYILDKNRRLLPTGVNGEIYISGEGVAKGYISNQALTAERFCDNPFEKGKRMYKTGDLARFLPNGNIEFLGRVDEQVKIRGFRIELGEIENRLKSHESIEEAVVLAGKGNGADMYLSAYFVSNETFSVSQLRGYLAASLPEYMIPSYFVQLEDIPLTTSGKLDRKALDLYGTEVGTGVDYMPPGNEVEETITETWQTVLNRERVGINDNFFDIGGNSLDMMKINARLKAEFDNEIPMAVMFKYPTIHMLARYLNQEEAGAFISDEKIHESIDMMEETMQMLLGEQNE